MSATPPHRRWYQFSLRSLLIAMTVAVLISAFVAGWRAHLRAQREKERIAAEVASLTNMVRTGRGIRSWPAEAGAKRLGEMGPVARDALPALREFAQDKRWRRAAATANDAIAKIENPQ